MIDGQTHPELVPEAVLWENATRCFELAMDESEEQTARILERQRLMRMQRGLELRQEADVLTPARTKDGKPYAITTQSYYLIVVKSLASSASSPATTSSSRIRPQRSSFRSRSSASRG